MPFAKGEKTTSIVELDVLMNLSKLGNEKRFFQDLIKNYLSDTKKLFDKIELAARNCEWRELDDLLHAMKGSAIYVGTTALAEHLTTMRNNLEKVTQIQLYESIEELNSIIQQTETELLAYIK